MFNLGFSELIVLAVIGLLVLGPEQLPQVARKLARILNELKRAADDAMAPVNDMKNQATQYIEKTREEMDKQSKELEAGVENLNKKIESTVQPEPDDKKESGDE